MKNKFYIDPKWKVTTPSKWVSKQDFKTGRATTWTPTLTNCSEGLYEPHIDGFEVTGDVQIKRKRNKEISRKPFTSTIKRDPLKEDQLFTTKSIRSYKSIHGMSYCII